MSTNIVADFQSFCAVIYFPSLVNQSLIESTINFSNSLIIHRVTTKEIITVREGSYLVLISIDFYDFSSSFTP